MTLHESQSFSVSVKATGEDDIAVLADSNNDPVSMELTDDSVKLYI